MQIEKAHKSERKIYTTPRLIVHGTLEEITADQNKMFGGGDGYLFMGVPIQNAS